MKVLLIGSGGREHSLAWKIAQSPQLTQLYTLPGNPGTAVVGINVEANPENLQSVIEQARKLNIDLVVIGPEGPLAAGLGDVLREAGVAVYGPSQKAAQLESSKAFAKDFMLRHDIPTAKYQAFTDFESALSYIRQFAFDEGTMPVIKASGLAAGKGVILPETTQEAEIALKKIMIEKSFGKAGSEVIIEERLVGPEVSILAFTDGKTIVPMPPAQDHKRLLDGDLGPNTGGMGVFSPSPIAPPEFVDWVVKHVLQPTIDGLRAESMAFIGTIYAGLILTENGPKNLEFNCRFGDPETQVILPLLDSDILEIFLACAQARLADVSKSIRWKDSAAVCVVLASKNYPNSSTMGHAIFGLENLPEGVVPFHAGTASQNGSLVTNGGRVLGISSTGSTLSVARGLAYQAVGKVKFEGMQYRQDIAKGIS
ncbi:MAG: phosphoribosylamine--glycine ligase [Anaerolineae bacterium]|nr:phosphoribosylamine--glycine ligase [Anaerolineae bacterium]